MAESGDPLVVLEEVARDLENQSAPVSSPAEARRRV
jgi:hypothetical protein